VPSGIEIVRVGPAPDGRRGEAVALLVRFFAEEGFSTPPARIAANLDDILADDTCWTAIAVESGEPLGVVSVTTMRYVEWGRLAEIGDLYVLPDHRGRGVGRLLVTGALDWCRGRGCSGSYVTVTPEGEARHGVSEFYRRLDFQPTGRTTLLYAELA
jgi:GNAT superfamily N-acetyltransferase